MKPYEVVFRSEAEPFEQHYNILVTAPSLARAATLAHQNLIKMLGREKVRGYTAYFAAEIES
jgi:hypothetical protein